MAKFRSLPAEIEATQWFKNGDHPEDNCGDNAGEGHVVRAYRRPDDPGERQCQHCGNTMHNHGWIDTLEGGHIVCPGDWVVTGLKGEHYAIKPDIFPKRWATPEEAARQWAMVDSNKPLVTDGVVMIANERLRQIQQEGRTTEHDDGHDAGQMADAAGVYACAAGAIARGADPKELHEIEGDGENEVVNSIYCGFDADTVWPWNPKCLKLSPDPIRNLEKAGALCAAEIDRLLRVKAKAAEGGAS